MAQKNSPDRTREALISLGHLNVNWVGMLWELMRYDQAVARADKAIDRIEAYLAAEPGDAIGRDICLKLHGNRAHALSAQGKHKESAADWTRVVALCCRSGGGELSDRAGCRAATSGRAGASRRRSGESGNGRRARGRRAVQSRLCVCAGRRCSETRRPLLTRGARTPHRDLHRGRAGRAEKAAAAGLFRDQAMREQARTDPDLEFVRSRPDFRQIIEDARGDHVQAR